MIKIQAKIVIQLFAATVANLVNDGLKGCQSHNERISEIMEMDRPPACKCA